MDQTKQKKKVILIGFLLGFLFFTIMNKGEKKKPLIGNSIIINSTNNKYHIHHWIIFLVLLIVLLIGLAWKLCKYTNLNAFILGICLGSILQGLTYNDAFDIRL